jgi:hypothetical protein
MKSQELEELEELDLVVLLLGYSPSQQESAIMGMVDPLEILASILTTGDLGRARGSSVAMTAFVLLRLWSGASHHAASVITARRIEQAFAQTCCCRYNRAQFSSTPSSIGQSGCARSQSGAKDKLLSVLQAPRGNPGKIIE